MAQRHPAQVWLVSWRHSLRRAASGWRMGRPQWLGRVVVDRGNNPDWSTNWAYYSWAMFHSYQLVAETVTLVIDHLQAGKELRSCMTTWQMGSPWNQPIICCLHRCTSLRGETSGYGHTFCTPYVLACKYVRATSGKQDKVCGVEKYNSQVQRSVITILIQNKVGPPRICSNLKYMRPAHLYFIIIYLSFFLSMLRIYVFTTYPSIYPSIHLSIYPFLFTSKSKINIVSSTPIYSNLISSKSNRNSSNLSTVSFHAEEDVWAILKPFTCSSKLTFPWKAPAHCHGLQQFAQRSYGSRGRDRGWDRGWDGRAPDLCLDEGWRVRFQHLFRLHPYSILWWPILGWILTWPHTRLLDHLLAKDLKSKCFPFRTSIKPAK